MSPVENPFDHNGECLHCDELGMHRADCKWLLELVGEFTELEQHVARQQEELVKANLKVEELRGQLTLVERTYVEDAKVYLRTQTECRDFAAKIQFLVDWADANHLLDEHLFTFPDGDVWEAKKRG